MELAVWIVSVRKGKLVYEQDWLHDEGSVVEILRDWVSGHDAALIYQRISSNPANDAINAGVHNMLILLDSALGR